MNEQDVDVRLGALLRAQQPRPDPEFVDRVLLAISVERQFRVGRRRAWRRALVECGAAIAVAASCYLLTQAQAPSPDGIISLQGPAMAGLVMLFLWSLVALPISSSRTA